MDMKMLEKMDLEKRKLLFPRSYSNPKIIKETIAKFGWVLIDFVEPNKNKGVNVYFNAICSNGHKTKTMMQLFRQQVLNLGRPPCHGCAYKKDERLKPLEDEAKKICKKEGVELLSFPKTKKENFRYLCKCGREGNTNLSSYSYRKTPLKCAECLKINKVSGKQKISFSIIRAFCEGNNIEILSQKQDYKNRDEQLDFLCSCGEEFSKSWREVEQGPRCKDCSSEKRKKTTLEKYGVDNVAKSEHAKKKKKETWLKKYGVDHNMKDGGVRKRVIETNNKNCGYDSNLSDPKCIKKRLKTMGGKSGYANSEIQKKANETCIDRHGRIINLGDDDTYQKYLKKSKYTKYFELDDGREIIYESSCEKTFLETMKELGIIEEVEKPSFYEYKLEDECKYRHYYPDYSFISENSKKDFLSFMSIYIDTSSINEFYNYEILVGLKSDYYYELHKEKNICKWKYVPFNKPLFVLYYEKDKIKKVELYYRILI